jgi:hypothetical protein
LFAEKIKKLIFFFKLCIHGDKQQSQRDFTMSEFRRRRKVILIATDVAARGLDIQDIQFVVNIDVRTMLLLFFFSIIDKYSFQIKLKIMYIVLVEQHEVKKLLELHILSLHRKMQNKHQVLFEFFKKLDKMLIKI